MNKNCGTVLPLAVLMLLLCPVFSFAQGPEAYSWSTTPPNVAVVPWTNQQIAAFLDRITHSLISRSVSDFSFADLDGDGQLELLAAVDFSGRGRFNTLEVVRRQANDFAVQQIKSLPLQTLEGTVVDLNNDGKHELLVQKPLTPYLGALVPQAEWTAIYGWSDLLLADVSAQFSAYYQSAIIPGLKQNVDSLHVNAPGTIEADVAEIEYNKALRVSGQDPNAGLAQALTWASSPDPVYRTFAAAILADIGTTNALSALNTLTTDPDPQVVIYAGAAVQELPDLHFTPVRIDIKPGDATKSINLNSRGTIPVAILTTPTFSGPGLIDIHSLTFGSTGTEYSLAFCNIGGEDVNGDGLLDLVCHFDSQSAFFQPGDAAGILRGRLKDGSAITGIDSVLIVNR